MIDKLSVLVAAALLVAAGPGSTPLAAQEAGGGNTKANLDLPFDAAGEEENEEEAPEIIVFYGQQYEGNGIFFSCDKSGSMREGTKFKRLQQEVIKVITGFSEKVQFGIVFFDANMYKFPQSGRPADANPAMKAAGAAFVMSTQPGSGTCCKAALIQCLNYAAQSTAKQKVIIYLSDGFTTCPNFDAGTYGNETLAEVTQRNGHRSKINTICIGPAGGVDEQWMRKLAQQNGGEMRRVIQ